MKYLCPYLQNHPKTPFWGPFNAKPIIQRALCKSCVNGATAAESLQLYRYRQVFGGVKIFPLGGIQEGRMGGLAICKFVGTFPVENNC